MRGIVQQRALSVLALLTLFGMIPACGSGGGSSPLTVDGQSTIVGASSAGGSTLGLPQGCTTSTYAPNFATDIDPVSGRANQLYHWTRFPTRVYFAGNDLGTSTLQTQAVNGFNWWTQSTNQMVSVQVVTDPSQADVTVQFKDMGATNYGAITDYHTNNGVLHDATITFNMTYLSSISDITPVAAHEFGHALGIAGHSGGPNDVMSFNSSVYARTALTTRDVNTLRTSYCGVQLTGRSKAQSAGRTVCRF